MSEQMTGADLEQLDELSSAYVHAGEEFAAKAATLRSRIGTAVQAFDATLAQLTQRTIRLTDDIKTEIVDAASVAAAVEWTGSNRAGFDGDLAAFRDAVVTGAGEINDGITRLRSQVDTKFSPVMEEFGETLQGSADNLNEDAVAMNEAVAKQRSNLDEAANVGWTSA
jgi:hypothetical protein